jgi:GNAT superfamily N-acetyltransferase
MERQQKDLWKTCFGDPDAFIDLYFRTRYTPDVLCADVEEGRLSAMLHRLPYTLWLNGEEQPAEYISGACTHPDFRGQGRMHRLIERSWEAARCEGKKWSFLIPASPELFRFYGEMGYVSAFPCEEICIPNILKVHAREEIEDSASPDEVLDYLNRTLRRQGNVVLHSPRELEGVMEDIRLAGGVILSSRDGAQRLNGLLFAIREGDILQVKECLAEEDFLREHLLYHACERLGTNLIHFLRHIPSGDIQQAKGTARMRGMICTTLPADNADKRARLTRQLLHGADLYMSLMMD